jgi:tetratricopeptide (TPR) repeat protein
MNREKYEKAWDLMEPHFRFEDRKYFSIGLSETLELREGLRILDEIIDDGDANWHVWWTRGKAFQSLEKFEDEYDSFKESYRLAKDEEEMGDDLHLVLRELAWAAARLEKLEEAVYYLRLASEFTDDCAIHSNYALLLLFRGDNDKAMESAQRGLENDFSGTTTARNIVNLIGAVQSGKIPQPTSYADLSQYDPDDFED